MNDEELGHKAAEIGLELTRGQFAQFARATALARRLAEFVPHDPPMPRSRR